MSPPPIEATRCQPSASASTVTALSRPRPGETTKATVSAAKATSAPRLSQLRPGSRSGLLLIRADSLRKATIEPVRVTAPMNTPIRSEEHTSELQSRQYLVCRLLLETEI